MAKFDRLVISGEQRENIDSGAIARVVIRLARHWLRRSMQAKEHDATEEITS